MEGPYYSVRTGINKNFSGFNFGILTRLFSDLYAELEVQDTFKNALDMSASMPDLLRAVLERISMRKFIVY